MFTMSLCHLFAQNVPLSLHLGYEVHGGTQIILATDCLIKTAQARL